MAVGAFGSTLWPSFIPRLVGVYIRVWLRCALLHLSDVCLVIVAVLGVNCAVGTCCDNRDER